MQITVKRWGNSLAVRVPKHMADSLRLTDGQAVDVEVEDDTLVIRPTRKRFKLAELLAEMKPAQKQDEHDWGEPKGEEEW
jgi:antitoxin MazE